MSAKDIIREARGLKKTQRQCLLLFMVSRGVDVTECSDGSRINLDRLDNILLIHIEQVIGLLTYGQNNDSTECVISEREMDTGESEAVAEEEQL